MSRLARFALRATAEAAPPRARYGPFWIAATLVFIAAAAGNLSSYLAYLRLAGTTPDAVWAYDIKKVSLSAVLFYGYISFLPLSVRLRGCQALVSTQTVLTESCAHSCTSRCATGLRQPASPRSSRCMATRSWSICRSRCVGCCSLALLMSHKRLP